MWFAWFGRRLCVPLRHRWSRALEEVQQLVLRLSLRLYDLLQGVHFVDKCLVGAGQLDKLLLKGLHLLLLGEECFLQEIDGLVRRKLILILLRLRSRREPCA